MADPWPTVTPVTRGVDTTPCAGCGELSTTTVMGDVRACPDCAALFAAHLGTLVAELRTGVALG